MIKLILVIIRRKFVAPNPSLDMPVGRVDSHQCNLYSGFCPQGLIQPYFVCLKFSHCLLIRFPIFDKPLESFALSDNLVFQWFGPSPRPVKRSLQFSKVFRCGKLGIVLHTAVKRCLNGESIAVEVDVPEVC